MAIGYFSKGVNALREVLRRRDYYSFNNHYII
jgi:hypothetical protein